MHRGDAHLVICGKHLEYGGKLGRISGLNIVNLTLTFVRTVAKNTSRYS